MLDCLILGDSIAVGVGQARPGCTTVARTGITSGAFVHELLPRTPKAARDVVISLGVNDDPSMATLDTLRNLRAGLRSTRVTWLLPGLKEDVRRQIRVVAAAFGDRIVDTISQVGADRLHPSRLGYATIAGWVEQGGGPAWTRTVVASVAPPGPSSALPQRGSAPRPESLTQTLRWQAAMMRPGGAYGQFPPPGQRYAALPPRDYAFGAFTATPAWPARPSPSAR